MHIRFYSWTQLIEQNHINKHNKVTIVVPTTVSKVPTCIGTI